MKSDETLALVRALSEHRLRADPHRRVVRARERGGKGEDGGERAPAVVISPKLPVAVSRISPTWMVTGPEAVALRSTAEQGGLA